MILWLLFIPFLSWAQDFSEKSMTVGARSSYFTSLEEWDNTFHYYVPEYADETFGEGVGHKRKFRVRVLDYISSDEKVIIDPLDVSWEFFTNNHSFQIGFLRYRFSESFGLQLLDVANPRDYSEFVFNDLTWSKRSVFGANHTFKWNNLQVQMILTFWPNGDRLPYRGSAFDPSQGTAGYEGGVIERPWFKDIEYGSRLKYLFESGLDLSVLFYHHFSRPTLQDLTRTSPTTARLTETHHLVDSIGTSLSYVYQDWVLRADALLTFDDLVQRELLSYTTEDHFQVLTGIDRTYEDYLLGLQLQNDFTARRHYLGVRSEYTRNSWWRPGIMVFKGIESNDQWLQVKNVLAHEAWKLILTYDYIHGGRNEDNLFGFYRKLDRFMVDLSFTY